MARPAQSESADNPDITVAEFFEQLERDAGPTLTADDHRALVAAVRADRQRSDRTPHDAKHV